jgi:CrcB protein
VKAALAVGFNGLSQATRLFLITGFYGGFTTFSAFGLETVYLLRRHEAPWALASVAASVVAGV